MDPTPAWIPRLEPDYQAEREEKNSYLSLKTAEGWELGQVYYSTSLSWSDLLWQISLQVPGPTQNVYAYLSPRLKIYLGQINPRYWPKKIVDFNGHSVLWFILD